MAMNSVVEKKYIPANAWAKGSSPLPTCITRSALFKPNNKGSREFYKDQPIASIGNEVEIIFSGVELRVTDDQEVLKFLLRKSIGTSVIDGVKFTKHEATMEIWNSRSQNRVDMLFESLDRMSKECNFTIRIKSKNITLEGIRLIDSYGYEGDKGIGNRIVVFIHPRLLDLLSNEFVNLPIEREGLNPSSIKVRDAILTLAPDEYLTENELRYGVLDSKANDRSFKIMLDRISDALIKADYLRSRIKTDHNGVLLLDPTEKTMARIYQNQQQMSFNFVNDLKQVYLDK